jgi:HSP20 family protein
MDRIWNDVFAAPSPAATTPSTAQKGVATPAIDIIDRDNEVLVVAEMPGVKREDISVSLEENTLSIKGEIKEEAEKESARYTYSERKYRAFSRSINLPVKIKAADIKATLKDGLLTVHIPKEVEHQPRKIKIDLT